MSVDSNPPNTCWKCHKTYPVGTKICITCGVDLTTGEDLAFKGKPNPDQDEVDPYRPRSARDWFTMSLPGLFQPMTLVGFFGMAGIFVVLEMLAMMMLSGHIILTAVVVAAVGLIAWAQGIIFLLVGHFTLLHEGLTEIRGSQWHIFIVLTVAPVAIFMTIAGTQVPS